MDTAESSLNVKGKGSKKAAGLNPRAKPTNWPPAISEFLLDWYIEKKLSMPPKTSFKRLHHTACTTAVNSKYGTTYSVDQVHRHWRRHRDTWGLVAKYLNESGGGWDEEQKLFTLSQSTLESLSSNDRGILTKPIQFFDKLQELFSGSTADGSFMQDASTAAEDNDCETDNLVDMMNDMSNYEDEDIPRGEDSDKLETDSDDCQEVAALAATASQVSSSNAQSIKPNKKSFKRAGKPNTLPAVTKLERAKKLRSKLSHVSHGDDDMDIKLTNSLDKIEQAIAKPVQVAPPPDPNAPLWDMLKHITIPADDKLAVGAHLCKPEFQVLRGFLVNMGQEYLQRWVYKYLSGDDTDN